MGDEMTREQHAARHAELHRMLDELAADYVSCTNETLSGTSVMDLIKWSHQQTLSPTVPSQELLAGFLPPGPPERMLADSASELTVQAIRVGVALVLRIRRGSDLVFQHVLGAGEEAINISAATGRGPIRVNYADVYVSFTVKNREAE